MLNSALGVFTKFRNLLKNDLRGTLLFLLPKIG